MLEEVGVLNISNVGDYGLKLPQDVFLCFSFFLILSVDAILFHVQPFEEDILIPSRSSGQIIFSTTPQEHHFDCPYQLSSQGSAQALLFFYYSTCFVLVL